MGLNKKTYQCVPGEVSILRPELAYIEAVHMVALNGNVCKIYIDESVDILVPYLHVRYSPSFGGLYFNENIPFEAGNSINVVYETV